jgi:hypothetical protein
LLPASVYALDTDKYVTPVGAVMLATPVVPNVEMFWIFTNDCDPSSIIYTSAREFQLAPSKKYGNTMNCDELMLNAANLS